jgi:hypothetical protein
MHPSGLVVAGDGAADGAADAEPGGKPWKPVGERLGRLAARRIALQWVPFAT